MSPSDPQLRDGEAARGPHHGGHQLGRHGQEEFRKNYQMTEEEREVLRECQSESFWYRAMPLAVSAGLLTQALISRGALTSTGRFGSLPKVGFACLFGYMAGKISYVGTCKQKFLRLDNSPIGQMMRQGGSSIPNTAGQAGSFAGLAGFRSSGGDNHEGVGSGLDVSASAGTQDTYSGFGQRDDYRANLDIDTSGSSGDGGGLKADDGQLDFELSNEAASALAAKRPEMTRTYEDLRRENRQKQAAQYGQALPGHYRPPPPSQQQPSAPSSRPQEERPPSRDDQLPFSKSRPKVMKNQYGDPIE